MFRYFYLFLFLLAGCAGVRPGPPVAGDLSALGGQRPSGRVQNLSLEQIRETLSSDNGGFLTLKAKAHVTVNTLDINGPLICDGYIRFQKPDKLRVIGTKLTSTVFDILTDGETFWLYLPSEEKVYTGRCNSSHHVARLGFNILPDDIAMLLNYNDALSAGDVGRTYIMETWPGIWLIHLVDLNNGSATLRANLYIDRVGVNVVRYDIFGTGGNIRVQALFDDYAMFGKSAVPQRITILWHDEEIKLTLSLTDIVTNEQIAPKVFQFSKPKTAEIIFLDEM